MDSMNVEISLLEGLLWNPVWLIAAVSYINPPISIILDDEQKNERGLTLLVRVLDEAIWINIHGLPVSYSLLLCAYGSPCNNGTMPSLAMLYLIDEYMSIRHFWEDISKVKKSFIS